MAEQVMKHNRLLEYLVQVGMVTAPELRSAVSRQRETGQNIMDVLIQLALLEEEDLARAMASFYRFPVVNLTRVRVHKQALKQATAEFCKQHMLMPFGVDPKTQELKVAVADPSLEEPLEALRFQNSVSVKAYVAPRNQLRDAIDFYYYGRTPNRRTRRPQTSTVQKPAATTFGPNGPVENSVVAPMPSPSAEVSSVYQAHAGNDPSFLNFVSTEDLGSLSSVGDSSSGLLSDSSIMQLPPVSPAASADPRIGLGSLNPFSNNAGGNAEDSRQLKARVDRLEEVVRQFDKALRYEMKVSQALAEILVENGLLSSEQLKSRLRK